MLNITSIKSKKEPELKTYKMVINFKPDMQKTYYILCDCVIQGIVLEYVYSHDCSLIPINPLSHFWEASLTFNRIGYNFKTDLEVLKDIAEHIRLLIDDTVDSITINPLDVEEN